MYLRMACPVQSARGRIDSDCVVPSSRGCASRGAWHGEISSTAAYSTGITWSWHLVPLYSLLSPLAVLEGVLVPACADCAGAVHRRGEVAGIVTFIPID